MTDFDWSGANREEQLGRVREASAEELNAIMRVYDWEQYPEAVLGWVSAQKRISFSSAVAAFLNGDPGRFNYLSKRDIGAEFRSTVGLLDSICQRINAGFYLPDASKQCEQGMRKLNAWIENQRRDLRNHRRGRWVIEDKVLEPMLICQREALENELRSEPAFQITEESPLVNKGFSLKRLAGSLTG